MIFVIAPIAPLKFASSFLDQASPEMRHIRVWHLSRNATTESNCCADTVGFKLMAPKVLENRLDKTMIKYNEAIFNAHSIATFTSHLPRHDMWHFSWALPAGSEYSQDLRGWWDWHQVLLLRMLDVCYDPSPSITISILSPFGTM